MDIRQEMKDKYPELFRKSGKPHVGDGWLPILEKLCSEIEPLRVHSPGLHFLQIKEKMGWLRIYVEGANSLISEKVRHLVSLAEDESSRVCERCGSQDRVVTDAHTGFWYKTLCKACSEDAKANPNRAQVPYETW
jgi:hypothetical protein